MISHHGPISGVAAFRDRFVLTAGYDNQVIVWDAKTRQPLARANHDHLANQAAFSPDGRYAVTSSSDYSARLWSIPDLRLVAVLADQDDDVEMSAFHPSKSLIATASRDHKVRVYDTSGRLLQKFAGHTADVISVEWMHGADEVVSSSDDGTIKRWSLDTKGLVADIDLNGVETDTIAIAADGRIFAGNDDGQIIVLKGDDQTTIDAHDAGIKRLVLDKDRGLLVSLSYDRTMRVWQAHGLSLELVHKAEFPPEVWPRSCSFEGENRLVFSTFHSTYCSYDWTKGAWDTSGLEPTLGVNAVTTVDGREWTVGDAGIVCMDGFETARLGSLCNFLSAANGLIVTGGQLGAIFDACTGRKLYQHRSPLNCATSFERADGHICVVGTYTGEGLVFRAEKDRLEHIGEIRLHPNAVKGIAVSDNRLFSVAADASATWCDTDSLEVVETVDNAHDKIANGCAALDSGCFASVSRDLRLRIWGRDRRCETIETPHTHSIKCVSASADGRHVATGSYNGRVAIYDRERAAWSVDTRPTTAGISSLAFDPGKGQFLASSYDGRVYRLETGAS